MNFIQTDSSRLYEEPNDCSIRAIVNLTGKPYQEIHQIFKELGRENNTQFDSLLYFKHNHEYKLTKLMSFPKKVSGLDNFLPLNRQYLIRTENHIFYFYNNTIYDTKFNYLNNSIIAAYLITKTTKIYT